MTRGAIEWCAGALIFIAMLGVIVALWQHNKIQGLQLTAANKNAADYSADLTAYRSQYDAEVTAINAEKAAESLRNGALVNQLNIIGDMDEKFNLPLSADTVVFINSLYAHPARSAAHR